MLDKILQSTHPLHQKDISQQPKSHHSLSFFSTPADTSQGPVHEAQASEASEPTTKNEISLPEEVWKMITSGLLPKLPSFPA